MKPLRCSLPGSWPALCLLALTGTGLPAQIVPGALPPTAPTQAPGGTAPLAATGAPGSHVGNGAHAARVSCESGTLQVTANNSSLNGILRSISHCTGLRVTGGVAEQRVFGNYGPAAPATVLATLLDGTGSNMLLLEAANGQPAQLILTPRTGGPTPPPPANMAGNDATDGDEDSNDPPPQISNAPRGAFLRPGLGNVPGRQSNQADQSTVPGSQNGSGYQTPGAQPNSGSAVTSPPAIPPGINNVLGSPANRSPTASTYPTTDSVPLDSVATPSTTPSQSGIVDAPNPPAAGSDTAAALSGAPRGTPGTTNISPGATGMGGSSVSGTTSQSAPTELTPEQVFQQLQQRLQQQQQQQQQQEQPQPTTNPQ